MTNFNRISATSGKREEANAATVSTGVPTAGQIIATNAAGQLDSSFLPPGIGDDAKMINATEDLSAGDFVNVFDDGGTPGVRLADRTNGRQADGFVLEAVTTGSLAEVLFEGTNNALTGLTIGSRQFLGTAGSPEETFTTTGGEILQCLGVACSATELNFEAQEPITRAATV